MQQVIVHIGDSGEMTIEAIGFKGAACEKATKAIEQALGQVKSKTRKPEYYQQQHKQVRQS